MGVAVNSAGKNTGGYATAELVTIEVNAHRQVILVALGNGELLWLEDRPVTGDFNLTPVQRAVVAARLHAWADIIGAP